MNEVSFHEAWQPASFPGDIVEDTVEADQVAPGVPLETRRVMSFDDDNLGVFTVDWTDLPFWDQLPPEKRTPFAEQLAISKLKDLGHIHAVSETLRFEVRPWPGAMVGWLAGICHVEEEPLLVLAEVRCGEGVMVTKHAVVAAEQEDVQRARAFVTTLRPCA